MAKVKQGMNAVADGFQDEAFDARIVASLVAMQDAFAVQKMQPAQKPSPSQP